MLDPNDYSAEAVINPKTRNLMDKMTFSHGGPEYDKNYPEGIPTSLQVTLTNGEKFDSKMILFPTGHAKNTTADLNSILAHKFKLLGDLALEPTERETMTTNLNNLENLTNKDLQAIYHCNIKYATKCIDNL